jgi:hypothetical protein
MPAAVSEQTRSDRRWRDGDFRDGGGAKPGSRTQTWRVGGED